MFSSSFSLSFSLTFSLSLTHTHTDTRHSIGPNFQAFVHIEPLSLMSPSLTYLFSLCDIGFWNEGDQVSEYHAVPFSKGFSQPRNWTQVSCIAGRFFTIWATREAPGWDASLHGHKLPVFQLIAKCANWLCVQYSDSQFLTVILHSL